MSAESSISGVRIHIELVDVKPTPWRLIELPADWNLATFHEALQIVLGWTNSHLHEFWTSEMRYSNSLALAESDLDTQTSRDETAVSLAEVFEQEGSILNYEYDFGDSWHHLITCKSVLRDQIALPIILDGAHRVPPEDVGGPPGYEEFLDAYFNPYHEEHQTMRRWAGPFDPSHFDLAATQILLTQWHKRGLPKLPRKKR